MCHIGSLCSHVFGHSYVFMRYRRFGRPRSSKYELDITPNDSDDEGEACIASTACGHDFWDARCGEKD